MVVKMMVIDSESTTKIEQNQEPKIGAAVKARLEQTEQRTQIIFLLYLIDLLIY